MGFFDPERSANLPGTAGNKQAVTLRLDSRELLAALDRLERSVRKRVAQKIIRRAAAPIRDDARTRAPVRTGDLRDSIKTYTSVRTNYAGGKVESRIPYAHLVEFGTKPHFQKRKLKSDKRARRVIHPGADPKPFLRPAFDSKKNESIEIARRSLRTEILKATR